MDRQQLLDELIALSVKKEIPYTKKQLEKMGLERLEKVYENHKAKELEELNEAIVDTVIGKFDELMKGCALVSKKSELGKKLQNKKLFRQDVKSLVSWFTPLFPYVGLLEGAVCVVGEVVNNPDRKNKEKDNNKKDDNKSTESEPKEGGEQVPPSEESDSDERVPESGDSKL